MKNKRKIIRDTGTKRERGTKKRLFFGIQCCNRTFWAEVVMTSRLGSFKHSSLARSRQDLSSVMTPGGDTWLSHLEVFHRLVNHGEKQYSDENGNHINRLKEFWGYLK